MSTVSSSLTCNQVWLFPLVDGCNSGYNTKLKTKNQKKKKKKKHHPWLPTYQS
jgi:hypothetical protein